LDNIGRKRFIGKSLFLCRANDTSVSSVCDEKSMGVGVVGGGGIFVTVGVELAGAQAVRNNKMKIGGKYFFTVFLRG